MGQFIVIGLGNFGFHVATTLAERGHEVVVIDSDQKRVEQIKEKVTLAVIADIRDKESLTQFANSAIDAAIVSLGEEMESSILATFYLKNLKVKKIIVKAISEDHGNILKTIGATEIIYPEKEVANIVAQRLTTSNLIEHIPLVPEYSIVEIASPDEFVGKTLRDLRLRSKYNVEVIAIKDVLNDSFTLIPGADFKINPDTALVVIGKEVNIKKLKL